MCSENANPVSTKQQVWTNEKRLCEFTRVMFYLSRIPHAWYIMFRVNACNIDTITIRNNMIKDVTWQRTGIPTKLFIPLFEVILETENRGYESRSCGMVKRDLVFLKCTKEE